jgi:transcriptional regulator with XRE-family HTH domain
MKGNISTRIDMAIAMLKSSKIIRYQKEVAERMGVDVNTVSRAKRGGDYNPENFAMNFNAAFNFMFSPEWLLYGTGEMLAHKDRPTREHPSIIPTPSFAVSEASASEPHQTNYPSIPDWADSLIHLASDNAAAIQELKASNLQLRTLLEQVIAENKELREMLSKTTHGVNHSNRKIKYPTYEESTPMSGELHVAAEPKNN